MRTNDLTTRFVAFAGLLALLILSFVAWVGYRSSLHGLQENEWVNRTYQIISELDRVQGSLNLMVAANRLYSLTGETEERVQLATLEREIREGLDRVSSLAVDEAARQTLRELSPSVDAALNTLARETAGRDTPSSVLRTQVLLARLLTVEQALLFTRAERAANAARQSRAIVLLGSLLAIVLTLGAWGLLFRHLGERRRAIASLADSEARNRALINAIPDTLIRVGRDTGIRTFKPPADVPDSPRVQTLEGRRMNDVFSTDVAETLAREVQLSLRDHEPRRLELNMPLTRGGLDTATAQDVEARFVPVGADEVLIIARDITDRKRVERLKNEFVSTVSHELRTPLTSIRGSLSLIASGMMGDLQPRGKKLVDIALSNSERLVRLINDILDIEKIESGKLEFRFQPIELTGLVDRAIDDNRGYAQQFEVQLEQEVRLTDAHVWGDPDRLLQTLTNLISNAVKFSPRDERVTITIEPHGEAIRVSIRDRGPGVPAEFRGRIFQRFAQADSGDTRQRGGTGLGLNISKAIIERHGGSIGFEDHLAGGTVFWFQLPTHTPPQSTSTGRSGERRLLICEDDPHIASVLKLTLERADLAADVAHSAEEAEQRLREHRYRALVLDLLLPGRDGISFIRQLRRQPETASLPIVVLSAVADQSKGSLSGDAVSVVDWINKPFDTERLLKAVRVATRHHSRPARILHVDDDVDLREVVRELLRDVAHSTPAGSLAEARAAVRGQHFDLVLLDLELPDGDGMDLLKALRTEHPPVPVLVFSASELNRERAEQVAATLVKSRTSTDELLTTIRTLVDSWPAPDSHPDVRATD